MKVKVPETWTVHDGAPDNKLPSGPSGPYDDGGGGSMDRLTRLEARVDGIDPRLDRIEQSLARIAEKALTKWDVAQVVFFVVGALMAAAIFGPRIVAMMPPAG